MPTFKKFQSSMQNASSPGMRSIVGLLQPFRRHMRVDLRRDKMSVAEQFLHTAQIRARVEHVRRVTVP